MENRILAHGRCFPQVPSNPGNYVEGDTPHQLQANQVL